MKIDYIELADGTSLADLETGKELYDLRSCQRGFFFCGVDLRYNRTMIICLDKNGDERSLRPCDLLVMASGLKENPPAGLCRTKTPLKVGDSVWVNGFVKETGDNDILVEIQTTDNAYGSDEIYINFNRLFVEQGDKE